MLKVSFTNSNVNRNGWNVKVATQAAQAEYESTCGSVILKMAINVLKDLYGNSGNRFEKINTHRNFQSLSDFLYPEYLPLNRGL